MLSFTHYLQVFLFLHFTPATSTFLQTPDHPHSYTQDAQNTSMCHVIVTIIVTTYTTLSIPKRLQIFTSLSVLQRESTHLSHHHTFSPSPDYADFQPSLPMFQSHMSAHSGNNIIYWTSLCLTVSFWCIGSKQFWDESGVCEVMHGDWGSVQTWNMNKMIPVKKFQSQWFWTHCQICNVHIPEMSWKRVRKLLFGHVLGVMGLDLGCVVQVIRLISWKFWGIFSSWFCRVPLNLWLQHWIQAWRPVICSYFIFQCFRKI